MLTIFYMTLRTHRAYADFIVINYKTFSISNISIHTSSSGKSSWWCMATSRISNVLYYLSPSDLNESLPIEWSATRILPLHLFWSPVCSLFNRTDLCLAVSCPRQRCPLTFAIIILFMEFSSSLLITWPYHLVFSILPVGLMHATLSQAFFLMASFRFLSFSETPSIHRSNFFSFRSSRPSSLLATVQASAPYISTGIIIVLYMSGIAIWFRTVTLHTATVNPGHLIPWHFIPLTNNTVKIYNRDI